MVNLTIPTALNRSIKSIFILAIILFIRKILNIKSIRWANIILWMIFFVYLLFPRSILITVTDFGKCEWLQDILQSMSVMGIFFPGASVAFQIAKAIVLHYGGKINGGAIGVNFTENVSVRAKYYTLRGYHEASNYYTAGFDGVERHLQTVSSNAYNQRLYEGFTPHTWKDGDHLASNIWTAIFGRAFPYVKEYR